MAWHDCPGRRCAGAEANSLDGLAAVGFTARKHIGCKRTAPDRAAVGLHGAPLQRAYDHGEPAILDFHRFVLLFSHRFSERVRFVGELELEHAVVEGLEETGELELEQAYIDFLVHPAVNFRAGMLLVPVGIINERHEPPTFHGVERPFVDTFIVPTTWFDVGAGVHGAFGRWLSLPRLRHGAARCHRVQRGRGAARRRAEGRRGAGPEHGAPPGGSSIVGVARTSDRRELLVRRHQLQSASAD